MKNAFLILTFFNCLCTTLTAQISSQDSVRQKMREAMHAPELPNDTIYPTYDIEKMPSFPGGEGELQKFLMENISPPAKCREYGACFSTVVIGFVVDKEGCIASPRVLRDGNCGCGLAQYYIEIIMSMPQWTPGEKNGKPVSVGFTLPVRIRFE